MIKRYTASELKQPLEGGTATCYLGVNLGALTVKVVAVRGGTRQARVVAHLGRPVEVLKEMLTAPEFAAAAYFAVCGHREHVSEVAAIRRALREVPAGFDAVVSLGGESFLVYLLTGGKITNVLSHNKCAAGSGEFLVQQIGRMGLSVEEAIRRSFAGQVVPLASRCSVHCKSDITHKLNRQEATVEDILHTLHDGMADKVIALLEKGQRELRRVLLIGGLTQNAAMLAALRQKFPAAEFTVLPESPWFEAWGSALLARDEPRFKSPKLSVRASLSRLPPLQRYAGSVQILGATARQPPPEGPMVLGVDAGSTTTKAVLLDPATRDIVASHYTRTNGDPVAAVRECLRSLASQVRNARVYLAATTGSAREIIGAYLGTEHVYNEISAQAAGATHFAPDVDTIFEIGGQDAKYIHLRNGVPMEYAMNNACSAGTGSFLEESAQGDLGTAVSEIAETALAAEGPVRFKATCAAFINSDIRVAQQEGHSRQDIIAGLVYAIAGNYLNRVKGARPIGRKVFLQGGVALNRAVGHAFAHSLGRPIVIPQNPELLGALGVALLAMQRSGQDRSANWKSAVAQVSNLLTPQAGPPPCGLEIRDTADWKSALQVEGPRACEVRDLLALAAPEMKRVGQFTCGACKMACSIDRLDVAGRRFPFGGRCSLYENVWKRKSRTAPALDLVEQRARLIFGVRSAECGVRNSELPSSILQQPSSPSVSSVHQLSTVNYQLPIGIPRALTTHSLFPLYSSFFSNLGLEVVLSNVNPRGELKAYSGFCFPAQIAHGAVLDLAGRGVGLVFLPHIVRMPQDGACRDSYLCPVTQAGPYFLAKAFPDLQFLAPVQDFTRGYKANSALVKMAVEALGVSRDAAEAAWAAAIAAQREVERNLADLGKHALEDAVKNGSPAILLAGRSYNAFTREGSQSVGKKLSSMGVKVIPADCVMAIGEGPTVWHAANQILNAVSLARQYPNLFLLCVSNFSCTIDAFTHAMLASELGSKPYLILEIDAHTADAGVQTRLEAFLDIITNYRQARPGSGRRAQDSAPCRCRLGPGGQIIRGNSAPIALTDPRVKIYFPNFSPYHTRAFAMAARWLGLHPGALLPLDRSQLERGLQYTSGRECLPLPICVGQLLHVHQQRQPGEVAGFYMIRGGAPCVSDSYMGFFERFIAEQRLPDLFLLNPGADNGYLGFGAARLAQHLSPAIVLGDILVEVERVLQVVGAPGTVERLWEEWQNFAAATLSLDQFRADLEEFIERVAALPRTREPLTCPRVVVTGDFFTRFSPFFMQGVHERYAEHGIILKPVDLGDLLLYGAYQGVAQTAGVWGLKPGGRALAKACTRMFQPEGKQYLRKWASYQAERWYEEHYRGLFRRTGLLVAGPNNVRSLLEKAAEHVSPAIYGETLPTVGKGLEADSEGYDGIIVIGPFNCLPYRISEAILKPLALQRGTPILTYESDGYAVSPSFLRQADVHIQQVLEHAARSRTTASRSLNTPA
jgi:predicted CoA-substrate-specific enzyme activase